MSNLYYAFIPISIALVVQFFIPYFSTLHSKGTWLSLPPQINSIIFILKYILLGIILYIAERENIPDVVAATWVSVVLNLIWGYYINRNNKLALLFLFLSLATATILYNEIFLSSFTEEKYSLYINLISVYIIWLGYMITTIYDLGSKNITYKSKKLLT